MFFRDDAVRVAALSEYVGRRVGDEGLRPHAQRRRTVPSCSDDVKKVVSYASERIVRENLELLRNEWDEFCSGYTS